MTNTVKPGIYVYKDTIVATAADLLKYCDTTKEFLFTTGIHTPMGEIIIFRALSDGFVQVAPLSMTTQLAVISKNLETCGVDRLNLTALSAEKASVPKKKVSQSTILCNLCILPQKVCARL
ncbi:MAG: hypothetical protein V8R80_04620 [Eubacterium sp.]